VTRPPDNFKAYDVDLYIAEIFDLFEVQREDIVLLRELIGNNKPLKILEPFCGNGRILIPMAEDGHQITGIDKSPPMLASLRNKLEKLPDAVRKRIKIRQANVIKAEWPKGFDVLILGGNCFYELAVPEEQEACIRKAQGALKPGGHLYLDNNHMEGELDPSWRQPGIKEAFPTGVCADGTKVQGSTEVTWYDAEMRTVRYNRTATITTPDGRMTKKEWTEQCHAPSKVEMLGWLEKYGFKVENMWGGRDKSRYTEKSARAVFWARLEVK
jgi:SAM-dependent methyltransferase